MKVNRCKGVVTLSFLNLSVYDPGTGDYNKKSWRHGFRIQLFFPYVRIKKWEAQLLMGTDARIVWEPKGSGNVHYPTQQSYFGAGVSVLGLGLAFDILFKDYDHPDVVPTIVKDE